MEKDIEILTVVFKNHITYNEVKRFRGAVIQLQNENNLLFHNHTENNYRYSYPLIQYKCIKQNAAIICVEEGVKAIRQLLDNKENRINIGNRDENLQIDSLHFFSHPVCISHNLFKYKISRWLPLNSKNYTTFKQLHQLSEKVEFLQKILIGNILSFTKGVGIFVEQELICNITDITRTYTITHKGVILQAFDLFFTSNISLPDYIGIGKNASMNCGIVTLQPKNMP